MAQRHMARALGPDEDLEQAARDVFAAYGRAWAELLWARPRRRAAIQRHVTVEGAEWLRACCHSGRGVILVGAHLASWDMAGMALGSEGIDLLAVSEALHDHRLWAWSVRRRRDLGFDVVPADGSWTAVFRLLRQLRGGGAVALLCDRDVVGNGVEVRFFGETTTLPRGPLTLALRTGAALLPVGTYQKRGRGHRVVIREPIAIPEEGGSDERIAAGTQRLAAVLEALVRAAPRQWLVLQPNWPSDRRGSPARR
jgi:KDO2-lipid IV(A) lauroyltransferase